MQDHLQIWSPLPVYLTGHSWKYIHIYEFYCHKLFEGWKKNPILIDFQVQYAFKDHLLLHSKFICCPAALVSPGRLLEMQSLWSHSKTTELESEFYKVPRWFVYTLKFDKHWYSSGVSKPGNKWHGYLFFFFFFFGDFILFYLFIYFSNIFIEV